MNFPTTKFKITFCYLCNKLKKIRVRKCYFTKSTHWKPRSLIENMYLNWLYELKIMIDRAVYFVLNKLYAKYNYSALIGVWKTVKFWVIEVFLIVQSETDFFTYVKSSLNSPTIGLVYTWKNPVLEVSFIDQAKTDNLHPP